MTDDRINRLAALDLRQLFKGPRPEVDAFIWHALRLGVAARVLRQAGADSDIVTAIEKAGRFIRDIRPREYTRAELMAELKARGLPMPNFDGADYGEDEDTDDIDDEEDEVTG